MGRVHQHLHRAFRDAVADAASAWQAPAPVAVEARAAATSNCADHGSGCETTNGASPTVAIGVGVAIPVVAALVVLIYLHRRHVRKLRAEDANDTHKSLDFGFEPSADTKKKRKRGGKGKPTMSEVDELNKITRYPKGLSMDLDLSSPYMMPPEMQQSHESLHTLSRALGSPAHDPYRPSHLNDSPSIRDSPRHMDDAASTRTGTSSTNHGFRQDGMNRNLLRNASRMSQSKGPEASVTELVLADEKQPVVLTSPSPGDSPKEKSPAPPAKEFLAAAELDSDPRRSRVSRDVNVIRQSNNYLANFIQSREPSFVAQSAHASLQSPSPGVSPTPDRGTSPQPERVISPPTIHENAPLPEQDLPYYAQPHALSPSHPEAEPHAFSSPHALSAPHAVSPPPRQPLPLHQPLPQISLEHEFPGSTGLQYTEIVVPPALDAASRTPRAPHHPYAMYHGEAGENPDDYYDPSEEVVEQSTNNYLEAPMEGLANHRLSIMRPLPPDDPSETAEQRANRIRSFYKEYFHENEAHAYAAPAPAPYYEDYGSEYLGDQPTIFDPQSGQFIVAEAPFAEPVTRRAMTPPPRGPPRFRGKPRMGSYSSNPSTLGPRSRAYSTISAGMGPRGPGPRAPPRRAAPPPKDLRNLPTPHLLKDDNIAIFGAMDFAPPPRYREQQAGRPASPFLDTRPYSPSVPVANPLASSFTELNAMPSPHLLRRSGTFTGLDFAPPPRFRDRENASDAGSIRSGRSNHSVRSAAQVHNLRAGTYRLSRIPKELVGSRREFADSLRPTWQVGS